MDEKHSIFLILLLSFVNTVHAEDIYSPAGFTDAPESLQNKIKFPSTESDIELRISCDALLSRVGNFRSNYCFLKPGSKILKYEDAIHRASKGSRIKAASINGRSQAVWFQYTVEFIKRGDREVINAYLNHGHEIAKYGRDYSAAQRYRNGSRGLSLRCDSFTNLWVKATINSKGIPADVSVLGGMGRNRCRKSLANLILKGRYIPAMHEGIPVESVYTDSFFHGAVVRF